MVKLLRGVGKLTAKQVRGRPKTAGRERGSGGVEAREMKIFTNAFSRADSEPELVRMGGLKEQWRRKKRSDFCQREALPALL